MTVLQLLRQLGDRMESNQAYFKRRADEEGRAAAAATCDSSREAHAELQRMFVELARSGAELSLFLIDLPVGSSSRHDGASLGRELAVDLSPRISYLQR